MDQESRERARGEETPWFSFFLFCCDRFLGCFHWSRGGSSGSVPSDDQSASGDPGGHNESMIQNFSESENQNQEEDEDEDHPENLWDRLFRNQGQSSNNQTKAARVLTSLLDFSPSDSMDNILLTNNALQGLNGEPSSDEVYRVEYPGDDEDDESAIADYEDYYMSALADNEDDRESSLKNLEVEDRDHAVMFSWWKELNSEEKAEKPTEDEIDSRYKNFKQFDMVKDFSDHCFIIEEEYYKEFKVDKPSKEWVQRIQHEWKILKKNLPETISVRVYEERIDLLRAVIIGPQGTPYHDALFFFDCFFPSTYPSRPPMVDYVSFGLHPNPNLHSDGTVCLSLLGTWTGVACENWDPKVSTMLQVLVSIQGLVLNSEPYFNEALHEAIKSTNLGIERSARYNEKAFLDSCETMLHCIRNPPKNFEDFVAGHFRKYGRDILIACRAYMDGMKVGKEIGVNGPEADRASSSKPSYFKLKLEKLFKELLREFAERGADCGFFLSKGQYEASASTVDADTTSRIGV